MTHPPTPAPPTVTLPKKIKKVETTLDPTQNPFVEFVRLYKNNPVRFVQEVLGVTPDPWQAEFLMHIAKLRNSASTNLLILDEIFDSSLDGAGTDFFTNIIRYVIQDAHVFVISHKTDDLMDKFEKVIKFDKIKGFSKMV